MDAIEKGAIKDALRQVFAEALGCSWGELEWFIEVSYKLGINPLDRIRKLGQQICPVYYVEGKGGTFRAPYIIRDTLLCIHYSDTGQVLLDVMSCDDNQVFTKGDRIQSLVKEICRERGLDRSDLALKSKSWMPKIALDGRIT